MHKYKYSYNIEPEADVEAFLRACSMIENANINGIQKTDFAIDVDGSLLQFYQAPEGEIKVLNDCEVGAVYADSDVDLSALFTPASFSE